MIARHDPASARVVLGFDFGVRRVGVALGNTLTGTARALQTIDSASDAVRFERIAALVRDWRPDRLVVGRPLDEAGTPTDTTRRAERFANRLRGRFGLPVEAVDERFSSREARAIIEATGGRRDDEDAVAAAVILEQWLDGHRRPPDAPAPG
jgi:putative Holliday junction resolvase